VGAESLAESREIAIFGTSNLNFLSLMAKGNLFLGMGRGSVGDVTFYRADGQQLARARNRSPRNPRSDAQLFQRAIMATVVQTYSAGKEIFDHSFEGYSVGAGNQREFIKRNADMLRALVAADINTPLSTNNQLARVTAPGVAVPVPNPWVISRGSYPQNLWTYSSTSEAWTMPGANDEETVASYAARVGLVAGDIYTIVVLAAKSNFAYESNIEDDVLATVRYCDFGYIRFITKSGLASDTSQQVYLNKLFDIEAGGPADIALSQVAGYAPDDGIGFSALLRSTEYVGTGAFGMIRSRRDIDLRSDSEMIVVKGSSAEDMFGLVSGYILPEWRSGSVKIGDSPLILEGGDI
jgi:hypothetical protein